VISESATMHPSLQPGFPKAPFATGALAFGFGSGLGIWPLGVPQLGQHVHGGFNQCWEGVETRYGTRKVNRCQRPTENRSCSVQQAVRYRQQGHEKGDRFGPAVAS
jgi:hypothetical protein